MDYNKLGETLLDFLQEIVNVGRASGDLTEDQVLALETRAVNLFGIPPDKPAAAPKSAKTDENEPDPKNDRQPKKK